VVLVEAVLWEVEAMVDAPGAAASVGLEAAATVVVVRAAAAKVRV